MGIALGIGSIVGARAAFIGASQMLIPLVVGLTCLAILLPGSLRPFLLTGMVGCVIAGSILHFHNHDHVSPDHPTEEVALVLTIQSDPRIRGSGVTARVRWSDQDGLHGNAIAYLPSAPPAGRGDTLEAYGQFATDQSDILSIRVMRIVEKASRFELARRNMRDYADQTIQAHVPGSPGSLALGLLIGDDSGLTVAERDDLRKAGLSHITAVSGWNVTVVVVTTAAVFAALRLRGWHWLLVQLGLIAGYVWIVGNEPPILRAALIGSAAIIGVQLGRPVHMLTLLSLAAAVMVIVSPETLESLSFQLSVLSMFGLLASVAVIDRFRGWKAVAMAPVIGTAAAALATAPLLAMRFGTLSLVTVPANAIVSPFVPMATYGAVVVAALGFIPALGDVAGWFVWMACGLILLTARKLANLPGAQLVFEPFGTGTTLSVYLMLALVAAPFFPEGRYLLRSIGEWIEPAPLRAGLVGMTGATVLAVAILAI